MYFKVYCHKYGMTKRTLFVVAILLRQLFVNFFTCFHFLRQENMTSRLISLQSSPVYCTSAFAVTLTNLLGIVFSAA